MANKTIEGALSLPKRVLTRRGLTFGFIIIMALVAFEVFNYSTTEFALSDLLGDLSFMKIHWATILALAFCGIDFAGIARLFTPEEGADEPTEVWYLFGAWLLAATMNAMLTWWGVSQAILENPNISNMVLNRATVIRFVPIFVAILVWLIRVLIIGTFSVAGERLFSQRDRQLAESVRNALPAPNHVYTPRASVVNPAPLPRPTTATTFRPAPKTAAPEPVYARDAHAQAAMSGMSQTTIKEPSDQAAVRSYGMRSGTNTRS